VLPWAAAEAQRLSTDRWRGDVRYNDKIEGRDGDIDMPVLLCWGIEDTPEQLLTPLSTTSDQPLPGPAEKTLRRTGRQQKGAGNDSAHPVG
jgi:hypothetical protein